jgi:hypothetical protein
MRKLDTTNGLLVESYDKTADYTGAKYPKETGAKLAAEIEKIDPGDDKKLLVDPDATVIWCVEKGAEIPKDWWVEPEVEITVNGMPLDEWLKTQGTVVRGK